MIALEFSLSQKCFHKSELTDVIKNNITNCMGRRQTDYQLICLFNTSKQCDDFLDENAEAILNYLVYQSLNGEMVVSANSKYKTP